MALKLIPIKCVLVIHLPVSAFVISTLLKLPEPGFEGSIYIRNKNQGLLSL